MSRRRVLLAWEQGRHLGHVARLAEMDALIKARHAESTWVVPHAQLAHPLPGATGSSPLHPAPVLQPRKTFAVAGSPAFARANSFADILLEQGFTDPQAVTVAVNQWLKLFESIRPVAILCDYAPVAQLAACLGNVPATQLTNGFDAPPVEFPAFDDHARGSPGDDAARSHGIERLSETIRRVGQDFGVELGLAQFLAWPATLSDAIPETDPYGERSGFSYAGPFTLSSAAPAPGWTSSGERSAKRVYAYLRGSMGRVGPVLEALRLAGNATCCVWPDATEMALRHYSDSCIQMHRSPVNLTAALEQADLVVNYGSASVLCSAVLAGKAQLMMPMDAEKLMFARRVESQGAGIIWMPQMGAAAASVQRLLHDESLGAAAGAIARRHSPAQLIQARDAAVEALVSGFRT
ncbi:hypothetical protein GNX71_09400 [Variovorax sp. RKNM96]|uniref:glycosyltransferase n=1 Tax=Variovorax sp. RKNM96 TaxID=2681552 RepID=UPI001980B319|nr:hypothetical protein [Variovorax sp. RKNM96]QSI29785.1 hypothetical protein GNX71_09400 [Variovorax sp. RKNM96]